MTIPLKGLGDIELVNIGLVVLVMKPHCLGIDVRLQRLIRIT
jgi:hypothetical protein